MQIFQYVFQITKFYGILNSSFYIKISRAWALCVARCRNRTDTPNYNKNNCVFLSLGGLEESVQQCNKCVFRESGEVHVGHVRNIRYRVRGEAYFRAVEDRAKISFSSFSPFLSGGRIGGSTGGKDWGRAEKALKMVDDTPKSARVVCMTSGH